MQKTFLAMQTPPVRKLHWRSILADILLAGLVVGPPVAPFLVASSLPLLSNIGNIIYFMGLHVCPQPEMGLALSPPWLMAVCMRCYGTVLGLLMTRLLYATSSGIGAYWLHQYRAWGAVLTFLLILAYPAELVAQSLGLWHYNNFVVFPFGLIAGLALGLYAMPLLHPQRQESQALA
jgi:uncharacterized membrane protein